MAPLADRDVFFTCGVDGRCLVRNDSPIRGLSGTAVAQLLRLSNASSATAPPVFVMSEPVSLGLGFGAVQQFCLGGGNWSTACEPLASVLARFGCSAAGDDCVLLLEVGGAAGAPPAASSWELLATPGVLAPNLPPATLQAVVASAPNADLSVNVTGEAAEAASGGLWGQGGGGAGQRLIGEPPPPPSPPPRAVTSAGGLAALFVTLTTGAQGRFSDNAVIIRGGAPSASSVTLRFIGFPVAADGSGAPVDVGLLERTLRVEHLAQYV